MVRKRLAIAESATRDQCPVPSNTSRICLTTAAAFSAGVPASGVFQGAFELFRRAPAFAVIGHRARGCEHGNRVPLDWGLDVVRRTPVVENALKPAKKYQADRAPVVPAPSSEA